MLKRGRGTRYGEPLNRRLPVYFTETQMDLLQKSAGDGDVTAYVRDAVLAKIEGRETLAVLPASAGVTLDLSESDQEDLSKLARTLGRRKLTSFLEDVAVALFEYNQDEVDAFLKGTYGKSAARQKDVLATLPTAAEKEAEQKETERNTTRANIATHEESLKKGRKKANNG